MKQCNKVQELLHLYIINELDAEKSEAVSKHLRNCKECSLIFEEFKIITDTLADELLNAEQEFNSVEWDYERIKFKNSIKSLNKTKTTFLFFRFLTNTLFASLLFITVFLLMPVFKNSVGKKIVVKHDTINKMENQLNRGDIIKSLDKGSIIISEFMKECNTLDDYNKAFREYQINKLLEQNRYIIGRIRTDNLSSAKKMISKINYLLYEISSLKKNGNCSDIKPIQDFVKEKQLLLKIKLIKDELKYKEMS
jgi:hypothetical protein